MDSDRESTPEEIEINEQARIRYHNSDSTPYERVVVEITSYIFPEKH